MFKIFVFFALVAVVLGTCDPLRCPHFPKHYEELGCTPIIKEGECCPWSFDCKHLAARDDEKCYFNGKVFEERENIGRDLLGDSCIGAAFCSSGGKFIKAHIDCAEFFGPPLQPACIRQYAKDSCCSVGSVCGEEFEKLSKCEFEGKTYREGERMFPEDHKCYKCFCTKDFENKPVRENKSCYKSSCNIELHDSESVRKNCAPIYHKDSCCPYDWRCPKEGDAIIPGERKFTNQTGSTCKFGTLELQIGDQLSANENLCSKCACTTPPMLDCVFTPGC